MVKEFGGHNLSCRGVGCFPPAGILPLSYLFLSENSASIIFTGLVSFYTTEFLSFRLSGSQKLLQK